MKRRNSSLSLFAIAILVTCGTSAVTRAEAVPSVVAAQGDIGEEGSEKIRIEPNHTELARLVRKSLAPAQTRRIVWFLKPDDSNPVYPSVFRQNMIEGLINVRSGGAGEGAFRILPDGSSIHPNDINLHPQTRQGRYPSAGLVYKSDVSNPFTLASISYRFATPKDASTQKPMGILGFSGTLLTNTLSITRIGVQAGPDGTVGTTDDIIFTSGPSTLPLHAIIWRGIGNWYQQADITTLESHVAARQPFPVEANFFIANLPSVHGMIRLEPIATPPVIIQPLPSQEILSITSTLSVNGVLVSPTSSIPTDIHAKSRLLLSGSAVNVGTSPTGNLRGVWRVSIDGGKNWHAFTQEEPSGTLVPGSVLTRTHQWEAGSPDGLAYEFQLRIASPNGIHDSTTVGKIRVVPAPSDVTTEPMPFQIRITGRRIKAITVSQEGMYEVWRSDMPWGPWLYAGMISPAEQTLYFSTLTNDMSFFKALKRR